MDLTKAYLEKQGITGELIELEMHHDLVIIAYAKEGCKDEFHYCQKDEAERIIDHWGATGRLVLEYYDYINGETSCNVEHPDTVHLLKAEKNYRRNKFFT